jgi:hypothetical protein
MSRMTQADRNQFERATYSERSMRPRTDAGRRATIIFVVVSIAILAALTVAAIQVFDGWAHLIVIADLIIFTAAIAIWLNRGSAA